MTRLSLHRRRLSAIMDIIFLGNVGKLVGREGSAGY